MPSSTVVTQSVSGADAEVISSLYPIPGLGFVPINAFLLRASEPVLVDTGALVLRDQYLEALERLIDLDDLRWIYLTHADPDHVGCLREVLAHAPSARIITTFFGFGKLGLYQAISPDRAYLLNPGQRVSVGDRELEAIEPVTFDAPETTGFVDRRTGTLFSSDSFGAILSASFEHAAEVPAAALREGMVTWATVDSPWLRHLDEATLELALDRIRSLAAPIVLGSHLPPAFGMVEVLLGHLAAARTRPRFVGPDQMGLTALLASLGEQAERPQPEAAAREHASHPHA
jgi:glyoxylase-like metal-dependent hydrolase (beta-lactamase superfamily II)